jgi:hypothetical protein
MKSTNLATAPPTTGHYEELNVFGSPTEAVVHVREGDRLPYALRSFTIVKRHVVLAPLLAPLLAFIATALWLVWMCF